MARSQLLRHSNGHIHLKTLQEAINDGSKQVLNNLYEGIEYSKSFSRNRTQALQQLPINFLSQSLKKCESLEEH